MLRSSNPVLSRQDAFTPAAPQYGQGYGQGPYSYAPQGYGPYGQPARQAPSEAPEAG